MNRQDVRQEVVTHLLNEGVVPGEVFELAEEILEITLPEGPYGFCVTKDCRNPAMNDIGFPVCRVCDELNDFGAAWSTAHADSVREWGVAIDNSWTSKVEVVIRERIAGEFRVLAAMPGRSPVAAMAYRDAARVLVGEETAT